MMRSFQLGMIALALAACANSGKDGTGNDGSGGSGGGGGGNEIPPDAPPAKATRFVVIGDTGKGNADQRRVAMAIRDLCAMRGCDFVLMLGDNIYDAGVDSTSHGDWQTKFEVPYNDVNLPFYVALGNHDNGGRLFNIYDAPGIGNQFERGKIEVDYTQVSTKWNMPATHYTFTWGDVGFIVLDTNAIIWDDTTYGDQEAWLPSALAAVSGKRWVFTAGHHPYRSNGTHGNAGDYDAPELAGFTIPNPLPIQDGATVKSFFDAHVCGISQVYFAGHDHSRQWINEPGALCGTEMIISGAGASTTAIEARGNDAFYEDASKVGFMYVVVDGDTFTGEFRDANGALDYSRTFQHP